MARLIVLPECRVVWHNFSMIPLLSDSSPANRRIRRNNSVRYYGKIPKKLLALTFFGIAVTALFSTRPAQAGYIVTLEQVGSDVVATGSGADDLTGLTLRVSGTLAPGVITANIGIIQIGGSLDNPFIDQYTGITGPTSFGSGGTFEANTNSGDFVGIFGRTGNIDVPHGYVSNTPLSDRMTFNNATFSSLGVTPGTYEWTWGTGLPNQNFTLIIGGGTPTPPPLAIIQPNGGEVWLMGSVHEIKWDRTNMKHSDHLILQCSRDGGATWFRIAQDIPAFTYGYWWQVDNFPTSQGRVKILLQEDRSIADESDANFTVQRRPKITLHRPNGGESWTIGQN